VPASQAVDDESWGEAIAGVGTTAVRTLQPLLASARQLLRTFLYRDVGTTADETATSHAAAQAIDVKAEINMEAIASNTEALADAETRCF
jgi:hypothetical protein